MPFLQTLQTLRTAPDEITLCSISRLQRRYPLGITTGHWEEDTGDVTDVDPDLALDEEENFADEEEDNFADNVEDNFADDALEEWLTLWTTGAGSGHGQVCCS